MKYKLIIDAEEMRDKYDSTVLYKKGDELVTDEKERADDLVARGLAHIVDNKQEEEKPKRKTASKK